MTQVALRLKANSKQTRDTQAHANTKSVQQAVCYSKAGKAHKPEEARTTMHNRVCSFENEKSKQAPKVEVHCNALLAFRSQAKTIMNTPVKTDVSYCTYPRKGGRGATKQTQARVQGKTFVRLPG